MSITSKSALSHSKVVSYTMIRKNGDSPLKDNLPLSLVISIAKMERAIVVKEVLRVVNKGRRSEKIIRETAVLFDFTESLLGRSFRGNSVKKQEISREELRAWKRDLLSWYSALPETLPERIKLSNTPANGVSSLLKIKREGKNRRAIVLRNPSQEIREVFPAPTKKEEE